MTVQGVWKGAQQCHRSVLARLHYRVRAVFSPVASDVLLTFVSVKADAAHLSGVLAESQAMEEKSIHTGGRIADPLDAVVLTQRFVALSSVKQRTLLRGAGFHTRNDGCL